MREQIDPCHSFYLLCSRCVCRLALRSQLSARGDARAAATPREVSRSGDAPGTRRIAYSNHGMLPPTRRIAHAVDESLFFKKKLVSSMNISNTYIYINKFQKLALDSISI